MLEIEINKNEELICWKKWKESRDATTSMRVLEDVLLGGDLLKEDEWQVIDWLEDTHILDFQVTLLVHLTMRDLGKLSHNLVNMKLLRWNYTELSNPFIVS